MEKGFFRNSMKLGMAKVEELAYKKKQLIAPSDKVHVRVDQGP